MFSSHPNDGIGDGVTDRFWPAAAQPVLFPPPTDAEKHPLDSSARNTLIFMGFSRGLRGLRVLRGERGRREEWPGERENDRISGAVRNAEVRRNPLEHAQTRGSAKKKTNRMKGWSWVLVVGQYPASNDY